MTCEVKGCQQPATHLVGASATPTMLRVCLGHIEAARGIFPAWAAPFIHPMGVAQ